MAYTDKTTQKMAEHLEGLNLSSLSKKTGIPYSSLYNSLYNEARKRSLRAHEFLKLCHITGADPMLFL